MKLTKSRIDGFRHDGRPLDVRWDSQTPCFGVRLYPSGRKSYVISYRNAEGRKRVMVIGRCDSMTLSEARKEANNKLNAVRYHGKDPAQERKVARLGATFKDLRGKYVSYKRHQKKSKTWREDELRLKRHIPPSWDNRFARAIEPHEIKALHEKIAKEAPYEANRLLALLRHMFRLGATSAWGYILPKGHINPCLEIEKAPEKQRRRFATAGEMPRIAKAIDEYPNVRIRAALWLLLLTGARKGEILNARWRDVDLKEKTLTLPDTKSGEEQTLSLSGPAIAIIQGLNKEKGNPYLLPGDKKGKPLRNIGKAWAKIRKTAKCPDLRLHDLRRTVGSWMTRSGVDLNTIKKALRHADISTTLRYAHAGEEGAKDAVEKHGEAIMTAAGKNLQVVK